MVLAQEGRTWLSLCPLCWLCLWEQIGWLVGQPVASLDTPGHSLHNWPSFPRACPAEQVRPACQVALGQLSLIAEPHGLDLPLREEGEPHS
jgi:hypothetical protein